MSKDMSIRNIIELNTRRLMPNGNGISETETSTVCLAAKDMKKIKITY